MNSSASTSSPPRVLILGANGRLGCAAARSFHAAGWSVLAQLRREASPWLPREAATLHVPLPEVRALCEAARFADVVIHAVNPAYTRWETEAIPSLRAGLEVADRLNAHFMLPGNVYNFGASMPPLLSEDTPVRPSTRKGAIRVEMEALMAKHANSGGFPASVIRAGDFFGTGTGTWLDMVILKSIQAGKLTYPGPMDVPHAWAYLPDLAQAFVTIAKQPRQEGCRSWHFEGYTLTGTQLFSHIEAAAAGLGIAPPNGYRQGRMSWRLIAAAGLVVPAWRELARMSYLWRVPHALDGRRLAGISPRPASMTPVTSALRESLVGLGFAPPPLAASAAGRSLPFRDPG